MKRIASLLTFLFVFSFATPSFAYAVNYNPSINVKVTPTPDASASAGQPSTQPEAINSFELFWPLAAGKTRGDSLYFLKTWKENLRGWFIFGAVEKAEYQTFLATKRVLETEALINNSKFDIAKDTEGSANNFLNKSLSAFESNKDIQDELKMTVKNRLDNLIKLVDALNVKTKDQKDLNEQVVLTHTLIEKNLNALNPKS